MVPLLACFDFPLTIAKVLFSSLHVIITIIIEADGTCCAYLYYSSWKYQLISSALYRLLFFSRKLISVFTEEKILCCLHARYLLVLPQLAALSFSSSFLSLASCYPQGIIRYKNQTKQRSFSSFFNRFLAQECQHAVSCFILKISGTLFFFLWIPKKDF